ncbi:RHS repeat protein [Burkholderia sp. IO2]|uniref:RHS repeat domain-containing protein n=1 Tax=Burkholderia cenocepacia TaxID=95486 RepID=UPI000AA6B663|nr:MULTISPECIES: RHS repeat domain-containing protein [Burkholderia]MDG0063038.1 RHS repeat protein [Burkholderia sp. IO2]MDN7680161.1 RHS repeat protein [Burkholderia cenocepacia]MEB2540865.1 RHS repeat domain-containing protein [Burkholderia cenocepacia]
MIAYTDCSGKVTRFASRFAYDARGALTRVTDAAGQATVCETDAMGGHGDRDGRWCASNVSVRCGGASRRGH